MFLTNLTRSIKISTYLSLTFEFQDMNEYVTVKMRIYLFHVSILGQWTEIFRLILNETYKKFGGRRATQILGAKVELLTSSVGNVIAPEDISFQGMNAVHLAAKFDTKALEVRKGSSTFYLQ